MTPEVPARRIPRRIPRTATQRDLSGSPTGSEFLVGGRLFARVYWHPTGYPEAEFYFDDNGRMHGAEREAFDDGRTRYRARWVHGLQHGLQQQWDERGELLVRTRFVRGTGLDIWFDGGHISESRHLVDGDRHGYERWWHDRRSVHSEGHFWHGREHGVFRDWTHGGKLERGSPRYFVHGKQVTRRDYGRAAAADPSLPPLRPDDDRPRRPPVKIPRGD